MADDATEVFEASEHAFDKIALAVGGGIVGNDGFSSRAAGDDGLSALFGDRGAQPICVIGLVGKQPGEGPDRRDQSRRNRDIASVAGREHQGPRPALIVRQGVDFGGTPASRSANGLVERPPFPPAAERCALIYELSMATVPIIPVEPVRAPKISYQTPCRLHR